VRVGAGLFAMQMDLPIWGKRFYYGLVAVAANRIRALPLTVTEMATNRLQFPFVRTQFLTSDRFSRCFQSGPKSKIV
jgi:hypothetical protein